MQRLTCGIFAALIALCPVRAPHTPPALVSAPEPGVPVLAPRVMGPPAPGRQALDIETTTQAFLGALDAFLQAQPPKVTLKPAAVPLPPQAAVVSARPPCRAPMTADVDEMRSIVIWAANEAGVDPGQLLRIPPRESGFNPDSVNCSSGACGLFQHMPQYWPGRLRAFGLPEGTPCTDARANALVAAHMFASSGFGPWYPSGPY